MLLFVLRDRPSMPRPAFADQARNGAVGVVERHPVFDDLASLEAVIDLFEIDRFLLQAAPQPFDENVIELATPAVHRDAHASLGQRCDPSRSRELRPLICIHDLRRAVFGDGFVQGIDAEVGVHRVRQPPAPHPARGPIHDGYQIEEAVLDRHERDIGTPDLIGAVDLHLSQQIREDRMLGMRLAGSGAFVDCLQTHLRHQPPYTMPSYDDPFPTQIGCDLAAAEERIFGEHPIDLFHHRQRACVDPDGRVIEHRPAEPHQLALLADTEVRMVPINHRAFLLGAHRFSPSDKKSFSTASLPILACSSLTSASVGPSDLPPRENTSAIPSTPVVSMC